MTARRQTILGTERLCVWCGDYWPEDIEFWTFAHGRVAGRCRACRAEYNRKRRAA